MASVVQQLAQTINGASTLAFTPVTITTGNAMLIVFESYWPSGISGGSSASSISDGTNTWSRVGTPAGDGSRALLEIWQTTNAAPSLAAGTITITWAVANMVTAAHLFEVSGTVTTGGPVDTASQSTNVTAAGLPNFTSSSGGTPTGANELYFGAIGQSVYATVHFPGVSAETFTAGAPSASYPSSTTMTSAGPSAHANLHTAVLSITGSSAQTYSGTLSDPSTDHYLCAVFALLNPPANGDFFLVL